MNLFKHLKPTTNIASSILYDEHTFYQALMHDLQMSKNEVFIESPFITSSRMEKFYPIFKEILDGGIKIHIITRDPSNHDETLRQQRGHYAGGRGALRTLKGNPQVSFARHVEPDARVNTIAAAEMQFIQCITVAA